MVSKTKKGFSEINGVRLWFLRDHRRRMYALCQVFHAFQNGRNRVPRTTFHKRLRKLNIDTKPCKLKQIHVLKWLKAVPSRTSKCSLISHRDMLKLCRACGVEIGKGKGRNCTKRKSKIKSKDLLNEKKKRKKKKEKDILKPKPENAEFPKRLDACYEKENSCSSIACGFANNTKILPTLPSRFVGPIHNACTVGMCRKGIGCACKQIEKPLPVQNGANSNTSLSKTVGFSFSQPSFGFQSNLKKTVHFDIHSTAFTCTNSLTADILNLGNMRGEIHADCERNLKEGNNMDDHVHASCTVDKECNGKPNNVCCESSKPTEPEKEYFGFTGQEKDVKSWQMFGDVPDQEGTAILDGSEGGGKDENIPRFVNGFQFAAAAQQIRAGFKVVESDSDQESVLSNLEINSNLSALSDLSVSSESLNSVTSSDTSLGDNSNAGWRARVGFNADTDSKCVSTSREQSQCMQGQPCQNAASTVKCERQNSATLNSAGDLWPHQYAKVPSIQNTRNGLVHSNAPIPKHVENGSLVSIEKARKDNDGERNPHQPHTGHRPIHKHRGSGVDGENHDSNASGATAKANGSTKLLVLKKDKKSWTVLPKSDRMLRENIKSKRGMRTTKMGGKRKSTVVRKEECEFQANGKSKVRRRKERNKEIEKLGDGKIVCDENGNYDKGAQISDCRSLLKSEPKSKPKVGNKPKNNRQRIGGKRKAGRDPRKVEELLKRKLEAISSELARLQKGKGRKNIGKNEPKQKGGKKSPRLKRKRTQSERRPKRTKFGDALPVNTFKMSDVFLLPPTLVVGEGELKPACSMSVPRGIHPPKCHPVWRWKLGGVPLPKPPRQTHTANSGTASNRK